MWSDITFNRQPFFKREKTKQTNKKPEKREIFSTENLKVSSDNPHQVWPWDERFLIHSPVLHFWFNPRVIFAYGKAMGFHLSSFVSHQLTSSRIWGGFSLFVLSCPCASPCKLEMFHCYTSQEHFGPYMYVSINHLIRILSWSTDHS